ncbi:MAG: nitrilase-related carbon-nitrogen hydrolase, partial [Pseudomonadota bacterium]|nr:nitrilase-related carbon-nitrogen hydrolase [Pseudomonadota bacterium]
MQSLEIKKINLCQLNPKVGAITENLAKIISAISEAKTKKVDVILFPELCLTGYPPNDILFRKSYQSQIFNAIQRIQELAHDIVVLVGHPFFSNDKIYNSASVIAGGKVILRHDKIMLPNREVFDEKRYFFAGEDVKSFYIKNTKCALVICEDIWHESVNLKIKKLKPELIFCINASPFQIGKLNQRIKIIKNACSIHSANYLYLNLVGGQDSLVFDGSSFAIDSSGKVVAQAKQFHEDKLEINFTSKKMVGA